MPAKLVFVRVRNGFFFFDGALHAVLYGVAAIAETAIIDNTTTINATKAIESK